MFQAGKRWPFHGVQRRRRGPGKTYLAVSGIHSCASSVVAWMGGLETGAA